MIVFPTIARGEPLRISASLYVTYLRCPGQALGHIQGHYGPETRPAFTGMLAHRIFARHLATGKIAADSFEMTCRQEIGQAMNPKLSSLQLRPSELRGVIAEVESLYERFQTVSIEGWRSVETDVEATVSPDVTLGGRVDAIFDHPRGVRLVDWKTGALGGAQDQLNFYALVWSLAHGEPPAVVEAVSVTSGERYEHEPADASLAATARQIVAMVATLRSGFDSVAAVPRYGGPGCRFCALADDCDEGRAALKVLSA